MTAKKQRRLVQWESREIHRLLTEHGKVIDGLYHYEKDWDDYRIAREVNDEIVMQSVRHYRQHTKDREGNLLFGRMSIAGRGRSQSPNRKARFKSMVMDIERLRRRVGELEARMAMVEKVLVDANVAPEMWPQAVSANSL